MRKTLIMLLCVTLLMIGCMGMAEQQAAEQQMTQGAILEMKEDGNLLCQSYSGQQFTALMLGNTIVDLSGEIMPGMIIDVSYSATKLGAMPDEVDAIAVRNAVYEGRVMEIDAENAMAQVAGPMVGPLWVMLPQTTDFEALAGSSIRFIPYSVAGKSISEAVETPDYELVESVTGTITEIGEGFLTLDVQGQTVRVVLKENTRVPFRMDVGQSADVFFSPIDGDGVPEEVTGLSVLVGNG